MKYTNLQMFLIKKKKRDNLNNKDKINSNNNIEQIEIKSKLDNDKNFNCDINEFIDNINNIKFLNIKSNKIKQEENNKELMILKV